MNRNGSNKYLIHPEPKKTKKKKELTEGEKKAKNKSKLLWQHPMRAIVSGCSGTGKSLFALRTLSEKDSPFDKIVWCAPEYSLTQTKLKNFQHNMGEDKVKFIKGLDQAEIKKTLQENFDEGLQTALVLDDLMYEQNDFIGSLFTTSRHLNASVIELTQRLFNSNKSRTNRLNTNYFVLFPFGADKSEFHTLARQMNPLEYKRIIEKYNDATSMRYGCLIIDANTHSYDIDNKNLLKFRSGWWDNVYEDMVDV